MKTWQVIIRRYQAALMLKDGQDFRWVYDFRFDNRERKVHIHPDSKITPNYWPEITIIDDNGGIDFWSEFNPKGGVFCAILTDELNTFNDGDIICEWNIERNLFKKPSSDS